MSSNREGLSGVRARRGGFTLLELILTIAIIVLLGLLIGPKLMNAYPRVAAKSEGIRLRADFAYAQQLAITNNDMYWVEPKVAQNYVAIYRGKTPAVLVCERALPRGVQFVSNSFDPGYVEFSSLGEPSEGGTVVLAGADGSTVTVTVKPGTGLVILECDGEPY